MAPNFSTSLLLSSLIAALVMAPVAPEAGNLLFLVTGAIGLLTMRSDAIPMWRWPVIWMPLAALALIGTAYFLSSGVDGLAGLLYFAPLWCVWPLVNAARRWNLTAVAPLLATMGLCGAVGAGLIAIEDTLLTGAFRAGMRIANPIHFADVALLVGFIGILGVFSVRDRYRIIFFAAPLMATIAVVLSGTRGAVIAAAVMMITMLVAVAVARLVAVRMLIFGAVAFVILSLAAFSLGAGSLSGIERVLTDISDTLSYGVATVGSSEIRMSMYLGGLRAFWASPWIGHGPVAFASVANGLADVPFGDTPHLHNDIVDLAASAGILGIVAYFLILLAPVLQVLRAPRNLIDKANPVLIITLVVGFFTMGLTNAMFGILSVTTLFAAVCVISGVLSYELYNRK